jgi:hypothetical protein
MEHAPVQPAALVGRSFLDQRWMPDPDRRHGLSKLN